MTQAWSQDSVRSGKPGTRKQCLAAARRALAAGSPVVLDRTNFDVSQRVDFISLAKEVGIQVHMNMRLFEGGCIQVHKHTLPKL